jgi:GNAT superfamily N-acetyltransferase
MVSNKLKPIDRLEDSAIIAELKTFPNQAFIWGILENTKEKQAWYLPSERAVILIEPNSEDPFIFVAGILSETDVDFIIEIAKYEFPQIYCNPLYHDLFLKKGWDFLLRAQLYYNTDNSIKIDNETEIKQISDIESFQQCNWLKGHLNNHESLEDFLRFGKAYGLYKDREIISEAYVDIAHNYAEISIETNPNYRRMGAATLLTSYIAEECKKLDLTLVWSCQVNNRPSLHTALKAGFYIERYYVQMVPEGGNTLSPKLEKWINEVTPIDWNRGFT